MSKINFKLTKFLILSLLASLNSCTIKAINPNNNNYKTVKQTKITRKNQKTNYLNKTPSTCKHGPCKSCYDTTYKPLWCDKSVNTPSADHHVPESMGPHGYNYDGKPWYIDDGYSHYNSNW